MCRAFVQTLLSVLAQIMEVKIDLASASLINVDHLVSARPALLAPNPILRLSTAHGSRFALTCLRPWSCEYLSTGFAMKKGHYIPTSSAFQTTKGRFTFLDAAA